MVRPDKQSSIPLPLQFTWKIHMWNLVAWKSESILYSKYLTEQKLEKKILQVKTHPRHFVSSSSSETEEAFLSDKTLWLNWSIMAAVMPLLGVSLYITWKIECASKIIYWKKLRISISNIQKNIQNNEIVPDESTSCSPSTTNIGTFL